MQSSLRGVDQSAAYALKQCLYSGPYEKIDSLLALLSLEQGEVFSILLKQTKLFSDGTVGIPSFFRDCEGKLSSYSEYSFWTTLSLIKEKPLWFYAVEQINFNGSAQGESFRLPTCCKNCPSLKTLSLKGCYLLEIPEPVLNLKKLRSLDISCNSIKSVPSGIGRLRQLVYFNAAENDLEQLAPQMGLLKKMKVLNLSGNCLNSIGFSFDKLSRLNELNLSGNCLFAVPEGLQSLTQLEKVDLSFNELSACEEAAWESSHFSLIKNYQWHFTF
ncbi:MAG: hypothetical protein B6241_06385 [Spirochaetaceae bacterium 4572_59]|nr:MAG: hypothetical protein B6241_06385 [Spirochaetaceae bacterium 4572_59]